MGTRKVTAQTRRKPSASLEAVEKQVDQDISKAIEEGKPIPMGDRPPAPPDMTPKQCKFADHYSLDILTASDAYRLAYDTQNMKQKQIHEEASKLLRHPKVAQRIYDNVTARRRGLLASATRLRAWALDRLLVEATAQDSNSASRLRALELIGKVPEVGLFHDRDTDQEAVTSAQIKDELIALLRKAQASLTIDGTVNARQPVLDTLQDTGRDTTDTLDKS